MAKGKILVTDEESKECGFEGDLIETYPSIDELASKSRKELIHLYRYLVDPRTPAELRVARELRERLLASCPENGS